MKMNIIINISVYNSNVNILFIFKHIYQTIKHKMKIFLWVKNELLPIFRHTKKTCYSSLVSLVTCLNLYIDLSNYIILYLAELSNPFLTRQYVYNYFIF